MNKEDVWNLFKETGQIKYYIEYKKIKKKKVDDLGNKKD